jgi:hypothetical protein
MPALRPLLLRCVFFARLSLAGLPACTGILSEAVVNKGTEDPPSFAGDNSNSVTALYPNEGSKWMDWVKKSSTETSGATDAACDLGNIGEGCLHGGERRKLPLTGLSSCTGITATDSLSAFEWECDIFGATATVYSTKLADNMRLSDLLLSDGTDFRTMTLTVSLNGEVLRTTSEAKWWSNSVAILADNDSSTVEELDDPSRIYTVPTTRSAPRVSVSADKVAVVVLDGATLENNGNDSSPYFISVETNYVWMEGKFSGENNKAVGVLNSSNFFSTFNAFEISNIKPTPGMDGTTGSNGADGVNGIQGSSAYTCLDNDSNGLTEPNFIGDPTTNPTDGESGASGTDGVQGEDAKGFFTPSASYMTLRNVTIKNISGGVGGDGGNGGNGGRGGDGFGSYGSSDYICDENSLYSVSDPVSNSANGGGAGSAGNAGSGGSAYAIELATSDYAEIMNLTIENVSAGESGMPGIPGNPGSGGGGGPVSGAYGQSGANGSSGLNGIAVGVYTHNVANTFSGFLKFILGGFTYDNMCLSPDSLSVYDTTCTSSGLSNSNEYPSGSPSSATLQIQ